MIIGWMIKLPFRMVGWMINKVTGKKSIPNNHPVTLADKEGNRQEDMEKMKKDIESMIDEKVEKKVSKTIPIEDYLTEEDLVDIYGFMESFEDRVWLMAQRDVKDRKLDEMERYKADIDTSRRLMKKIVFTINKMRGKK